METQIIINQHNAYNATSDPTANDDETLGYRASNNASRWFNINTGVLWVCVDDTEGAAVWKMVDGIEVIQAVIVGDVFATVGNVEYNIPSPYKGRLVAYKVYCQEPPTGSASVVGLKKNATPITTIGVSVPSGGNHSITVPVFSDDTVDYDDIITPTFTSVGSTTAGKKFIITIYIEKSE